MTYNANEIDRALAAFEENGTIHDIIFDNIPVHQFERMGVIDEAAMHIEYNRMKIKLIAEMLKSSIDTDL